MTPRRYAIYYLPGTQEPWADFCTRWLGWDFDTGRGTPPPAQAPDAHDLTEAPRRYGLHATLKPPFRLAPGTAPQDLETATAALAARHAPVRIDGLRVAPMGMFLALRPDGEESALCSLAAACVRDLDRFRAPATDAELSRRRTTRMSHAQSANLARWGYPHVMDCFHFHITLSSRLPPGPRQIAANLLERHLVPLLPRPHVLGSIALCGEDPAGRFHLIRRFPLTGQTSDK